jgi:ubiquinone/menaquinone biosynthesis C-methylase UbiE
VTPDNAKKIAAETQNSYDIMAKEFSRTRAKFWDELAFLAENIKRDDHVLDIGSGNGRFSPLVSARHAHYTGVDYAEGLVTDAKQAFPSHAFILGDATALPFPSHTFDCAFSFAVIHHIPTRLARQKFMDEAYRVLLPGGKFIFTSWDLLTPKHFGALALSGIRSLIGKNALDVGDVMLTFGKQKHPRFVHACTKREIYTLARRSGFQLQSYEKISRKSGEQNIVVILHKPMT